MLWGRSLFRLPSSIRARHRSRPPCERGRRANTSCAFHSRQTFVQWRCHPETTIRNMTSLDLKQLMEPRLLQHPPQSCWPEPTHGQCFRFLALRLRARSPLERDPLRSSSERQISKSKSFSIALPCKSEANKKCRSLLITGGIYGLTAIVSGLRSASTSSGTTSESPTLSLA